MSVVLKKQQNKNDDKTEEAQMLKQSIFANGTSLQSSLTHKKHCECLGYFTPLYNRITAQVLVFSESCDFEVKVFNMASKCSLVCRSSY